MKRFTIKRIASDLDWATFGVMLHERIPFAVTVELPWINNEKGKSCIPLDLYVVELSVPTQKIPYFHYVYLNVAGGREGCALHKANLARQLEGCTAIGESFDLVLVNPKIGAELGIAGSQKGYTEFMTKAGNDRQIEIQIVQG